MLEGKKIVQLTLEEATRMLTAGEPVTIAKRLTLEYRQGMEGFVFRLEGGDAATTLDRTETRHVRDLLTAALGE